MVKETLTPTNVLQPNGLMEVRLFSSRDKVNNSWSEFVGSKEEEEESSFETKPIAVGRWLLATTAMKRIVRASKTTTSRTTFFNLPSAEN